MSLLNKFTTLKRFISNNNVNLSAVARYLVNIRIQNRANRVFLAVEGHLREVDNSVVCIKVVAILFFLEFWRFDDFDPVESCLGLGISELSGFLRKFFMRLRKYLFKLNVVVKWFNSYRTKADSNTIRALLASFVIPPISCKGWWFEGYGGFSVKIFGKSSSR